MMLCGFYQVMCILYRKQASQIVNTQSASAVIFHIKYLAITMRKFCGDLRFSKKC